MSLYTVLLFILYFIIYYVLFNYYTLICYFCKKKKKGIKLLYHDI